MLIVADMDGTLTESRQAVEKEIINVICEILQKHLFAVISGATYERIKKQVLDNLPITPDIKNMYVVAQSGAEIYDHSEIIYKKSMSVPDKTLVKMLLRSMGLPRHEEILKTYSIRIGPLNPLIMDKGSQITFSIAGVNTEIEVKRRVDPDTVIRKAIVERLKPFLPPHIRMAIGGTTSIDFTPEEIGKRSGVQYLQKYLSVKTGDVVYVGDKCFEGGNDWIGEEYNYHNVSGPTETLKILKGLI